jgi:hypothetical protein
MSLAKQYGADRIWMSTSVHFKGYELPTEYFPRSGVEYEAMDQRKHQRVHTAVGG